MRVTSLIARIQLRAISPALSIGEAGVCGKEIRSTILYSRDTTKGSTAMSSPRVGIIMGSDSDRETMEAAAAVCGDFGVPCEMRVLSAHRTPDDTAEYAKSAARRGIAVIIAGAGGAAHLPGVVAASTVLPVIGVPIQSKALNGLDSLLSIVQMPPGVPVATVGIGAGRNAGLLPVQIVAAADKALRSALVQFKERIAMESRTKNQKIS